MPVDPGLDKKNLQQLQAEDKGPGLVQELLNDIPGVSGIDRVGADLEAGYLAVTDVTLWRSLGWLALGLILIVAGLLLWLRGPVNTLSNQLLQELP